MVKIPKELLYLILGVFITLIFFSIFRAKPETKPILQVKTDTIVVEKTKIKVKPLPPETIQIQNVVSDTIKIENKVIQWREYFYQDSLLKLSIEADTIRKITYTITVKQKPVRPKTHQVILLATPTSLVGLSNITKNVVIGAGWNFREKVPEIAVGVSAKW